MKNAHSMRFPFVFRLALCLLLLLCASVFLSGCAPSQPDFSAELSDPGALTRGCKVMWQQQEVGIVTRVQPQANSFVVGARLWRQYRGQIHHGASASVAIAPTTQKPVLKIYGGTSTSRPPLAKGDVIAQASTLDRMEIKQTFIQWFTSSSYIRILVIGLPIAFLALWLVFKFAKRIVRFGLTLVLLMLVAVLCWVIRFEWQRHKDTIVPPDTRSTIEEFLDRTFKSTEVQQFWDVAREEFADMWKAAKEDTGAASAQAKDTIQRKLDDKIRSLREQGKDDAVREVERLRDSIMDRMARDESPYPPDKPKPDEQSP